MKIALFGSTQYKEQMKIYKIKMEMMGHEVRTPVLDDHGNLTALQICERNRESAEWAEQIDLFWNQRTMGTVFDMGMVFALRKPMKFVFLEEKTLADVIREYSGN